MSTKDVQNEKLKALQLTMEKLDKTFGKGAVMKLGDSPVEKEKFTGRNLLEKQR